MSWITLPPPVLLHKARAAASPLMRVADAATPRLRRFWQALWQDVQGALPITWALSSLDTVVRAAWQQVGLPRLEDLHAVLQALAQAATETLLLPLTSERLGVAQATQAIETSLSAVPQTMARLSQVVDVQPLLSDVAVLTIPQQETLARMAEGFAADTTMTPAYIERALRMQATRALTQRTDVLSGHLVWTAVQAGQQAGWEQDAATGGLAAAQLRRYWMVMDDERLCPRCEPLPGLNPAGVGLTEPFASDDGPILSPPLHVNCRCNVALQEG